MGAIPEELAEVDRFLSERKYLSDGLPIWQEISRRGQIEAIWNIVDELGISQAHLRFSVLHQQRDEPSVSIIFKGQPIWRLDVVDPTFCKDNHLEAMSLGLPSRICGSHCHSWKDNRSYVAKNGFGVIPVRRPVQAQLRRVSQMLPWLADETSIELTPDQRRFDGPSHQDLFGISVR